MNVVKLKEVSSWLQATKLDTSSIDDQLEETYRDLVYSKVSALYDIDSWDSPDTTPSLIRKVIGLYIAARLYKRAYSEEDFGGSDSSNYGDELERLADSVLASIIDGSADLVDGGDPLPTETTSQPVFWPTDQTGLDDDGRSSAQFAMGQVY